jgi:hypothetical protein
MDLKTDYQFMVDSNNNSMMPSPSYSASALSPTYVNNEVQFPLSSSSNNNNTIQNDMVVARASNMYEYTCNGPWENIFGNKKYSSTQSSSSASDSIVGGGLESSLLTPKYIT